MEVSKERIEEEPTQDQEDFIVEIDDETEESQSKKELEISKVPAAENKSVEKEAEVNSLLEKSPQNVRISVFDVNIFC